MVHALIFKLKQGMIHVLRCHFIAVFSKSSMAYTCINWPTPLSSKTSLSRVCGRRVANVDGYMLLKDGTLCTRFRSISSVNAPLLWWRPCQLEVTVTGCYDQSSGGIGGKQNLAFSGMCGSYNLSNVLSTYYRTSRRFRSVILCHITMLIDIISNVQNASQLTWFCTNRIKGPVLVEKLCK